VAILHRPMAATRGHCAHRTARRYGSPSATNPWTTDSPTLPGRSRPLDDGLLTILPPGHTAPFAPERRTSAAARWRPRTTYMRPSRWQQARYATRTKVMALKANHPDQILAVTTPPRRSSMPQRRHPQLPERGDMGTFRLTIDMNRPTAASSPRRRTKHAVEAVERADEITPRAPTLRDLPDHTVAAGGGEKQHARHH
jgi:hypothetical protein